MAQASWTVADSPVRGIVLKLLSILSFVGMQTAIKAAGDDVPAGETVFFRSFFALLPVIVYLAYLKELRTAFRTDDLTGHLFRGMIGVVSMGLGFYSITKLPYPEWITISYAAPLMTVILAAIFLKEVVRAYRLTAVAIGLCGVAVVTMPRFSVGLDGLGTQETLGIAAALASAVFAAIAMIQVRRLVRQEKTATIVLYFTLTCSFFSFLSLPFGWIVPSGEQAALLVLCGVLGGVGQLLLTAAYRHADTSTIAPFEYSSLILAVVVGTTLFGEVISLNTLAGGAIVASAGIFIIWRESRLGIERRKVRQARTPEA